MAHEEITIDQSYVSSLIWADGGLADPVRGQMLRAGKWAQAGYTFAGLLDAAIVSPSGRYQVLFTRLGTKGVVLKDGAFLREIDRSYYKAEAYEYPVAIALSGDDRELLIHCPQAYNILQAEDIETGEIIQAGFEPETDYFHSCLSVGPDNLYLVSAGWVWHPFCAIRLYERYEGRYRLWGDKEFLPTTSEVVVAQFVDGQTLCVATSDAESLDPDNEDPAGIGPNAIAIWSLEANSLIASVSCGMPVGDVMPLDRRFAVSFYQHPRLWDLKEKQLAYEWPDINSGTRTSSIIWTAELVPIAKDPANRRFAVAGKDSITVVKLDLPQAQEEPHAR